MILSSADIKDRLGKDVIIEPFDHTLLNPDSYDFELGSWFYLALPMAGNPHFFGPYFFDVGEIVPIPWPGTLLGMTRQVFGGLGKVLYTVRSRSTTRRGGLHVCDDAGFAETGYVNHITVELSADAPGYQLPAGARIGQVVFEESISPPLQSYSGQYNLNEWPICMIPKAYRNHQDTCCEPLLDAGSWNSHCWSIYKSHLRTAIYHE